MEEQQKMMNKEMKRLFQTLNDAGYEVVKIANDTPYGDESPACFSVVVLDRSEDASKPRP
jgi:hypothetical protein